MQKLFKVRSVPRSFVRCVMGKPYVGEEWELWRKKEEAKELCRAKELKDQQDQQKNSPEKFTKSFQDYLNSIPTYEDLNKPVTPSV